MVSVNIIYASTSGHTEYVIQVLEEHMRSCQVSGVSFQVNVKRAEAAGSGDLLTGDILVLASGTWNTGGVEGQLNPHMYEFLLGRAKDVHLKGKHVAIIALGDDRYFYTCRAGEHLRQFVQTHGGHVLEPPLLIVNEPYGQEEKIRAWGEKLLVTRYLPAGKAGSLLV